MVHWEGVRGAQSVPRGSVSQNVGQDPLGGSQANSRWVMQHTGKIMENMGS